MNVTTTPSPIIDIFRALHQIEFYYTNTHASCISTKQQQQFLLVISQWVNIEEGFMLKQIKKPKSCPLYGVVWWEKPQGWELHGFQNCNKGKLLIDLEHTSSGLDESNLISELEQMLSPL